MKRSLIRLRTSGLLIMSISAVMQGRAPAYKKKEIVEVHKRIEVVQKAVNEVVKLESEKEAGANVPQLKVDKALDVLNKKLESAKSYLNTLKEYSPSAQQLIASIFVIGILCGVGYEYAKQAYAEAYLEYLNKIASDVGSILIAKAQKGILGYAEGLKYNVGRFSAAVQRKMPNYVEGIKAGIGEFATTAKQEIPQYVEFIKADIGQVATTAQREMPHYVEGIKTGIGKFSAAAQQEMPHYVESIKAGIGQVKSGVVNYLKSEKN